MADKDAEPKTPEAPELNPKMFVVPALMMGVKYLKLDLNMCVSKGRHRELERERERERTIQLVPTSIPRGRRSALRNPAADLGKARSGVG